MPFQKLLAFIVQKSLQNKSGDFLRMFMVNSARNRKIVGVGDVGNPGIPFYIVAVNVINSIT